MFYDNAYYVGEILQVHDDTAEVTFMDQVPDKNIFRWKNEDIDTVHRKYVFMWDVEMVSQNGRSWSVANHAKLVKLYLAFQEKYCK